LLLVGVAAAQDSMNVRRVGMFATAPDRALDVAVIGDYAYLTDDSLFRVIYLGDPEQPPVQVGSVGVPGTRLAVQGNHAYVVAKRNGLSVVSVADPTNPIEVGHIDAKRSAEDVDVDGDYAYVADLDSGLRVISVADPTNPVEVAHIDTIGVTFSVAVSGNYAYVFGGELSIVQISDPEHPVTVGRCNIPGWATYGAVSGYYAYVVTYRDGLVVIRVADPTHPVQVWQRDWDYGGVAVQGSHLYVGAKGVKVFSLADPGRPVEIGHYTIGGTSGAAGVAADGEYAYVACSWAGLQIYQYYGAGVEESHKPHAEGCKPTATVMRGVLMIGDRGQGTGDGAELLDAAGRKVLRLHAGANDVSALAPGVYFVCEEPQAVRRVIVAE
jgi:hypothetical protein